MTTTVSTEQLHAIAARVAERMAEFGKMASYMPEISPGVLRIVLGVLADMEGTPPPAPAPAPEAKPALPRPVPRALPNTGHSNGHSNGHAEVTPTVASVLGPEHTIVSPLQPVVAKHTDKLAELPTNADEGEGTLRYGKYQPTLDEMIQAVRKMAMGGIMPSLATFNTARPANWATADAQLKRLGLTWTELAEQAGLKGRSA